MDGPWRARIMWRFALAHATGTSHLRVDVPCQDRCACVVLPNGIVVAALADGAGSAQFAEQGAELVVNEMIKSLSGTPIEVNTDFAELIRGAEGAARENVAALAAQHNKTPRDFASTLLAVI